MRLTYIYHSGFAIEADEFAILIDYYKDTGRSPEKGFVHEKLLNRAGTLYILSSHFHPDHFNPEVLRWKTYKKDIVYLFGKTDKLYAVKPLFSGPLKESGIPAGSAAAG